MTGDRLFTVPELRRAVRELAAFVADDRAPATPQVQNALEIYISACRLVNDRVGESDRLLSLGQRSEALRQIQMEPDSLAMFDVLTFEHYKHLPKVAEDFKLQPPPKLNVGAARRLNQAYSVEKEGEGLMQEHRALALARAPLKRRLEVIRLLQRAEPQSSFWQDDIAAYEAARFDEIRGVLANPASRDDWTTLRDLHDEFSSTTWQTACPLDIMDIVKHGLTRVRREQAQYELEPLIQKFERAIEAEDLDKVAQLIAAAIKVQEKYKLGEESPLLKPVWKAEGWLKDSKREEAVQYEYDLALVQLENSLDQGFEWYYIQEYYRIVAEFQRPIPKRILAKYEARGKGKLWIWIVGGAVLALALGGGVAILVVKLL